MALRSINCTAQAAALLYLASWALALLEIDVQPHVKESSVSGCFTSLLCKMALFACPDKQALPPHQELSRPDGIPSSYLADSSGLSL